MTRLDPILGEKRERYLNMYDSLSAIVQKTHIYPECLVLACWVVVVMVLLADSAAAVGFVAVAAAAAG